MVSNFRRITNSNVGAKLSRRQFKQVVKIVNSKKQIKRNYFMLPSFQAAPLGATAELTSIAEGDDWNQRDSDRIQVQKIKGSFVVIGLDSANTIRFMIVRSKIGPLTLAAFPTLTGVPDLDKMQVYFDRTYITTSACPVVPERQFVNIKFKKGKIPGLNVGYDDNVSSSFAQNNPIYIYAISDSQVTPDPIFNGDLVVSFYDMK